ncbi:MAG: hypothetical protein JXA21_09385 [Anaerolineae bacterium]|nr:hypothetical protein [Anaerolineae bacterium]
MRTNVRVLGWLYIVMGVLGVFLGVLILAFLLGLGALVGIREVTGILSLVGLFSGGYFVLISAPGILVGIGLLSFRPWARVMALILAVLNLPWVPLGTVLGVYAFLSLTPSEAAVLFE